MNDDCLSPFVVKFIYLFVFFSLIFLFAAVQILSGSGLTLENFIVTTFLPWKMTVCPTPAQHSTDLDWRVAEEFILEESKDVFKQF